MQLPLQRSFELLQTKWKSILDPLLANPLNGVSILKSIKLTSGNNQVQHLLDRIPEGWFIVDTNAASTIYRYQPSTINYLYLNASANATVNIGVF